MIHLIADLTLHPGAEAELRAAARIMIDATRREHGCIRYTLMQDVLDPLQFSFVEEWTDRQALAAHFETPHMAVWRAAQAPLVASRAIKIIHADKVETL
jgi:quinol monooxygenase YgiN